MRIDAWCMLIRDSSWKAKPGFISWTRQLANVGAFYWGSC